MTSRTFPPRSRQMAGVAILAVTLMFVTTLFTLPTPAEKRAASPNAPDTHHFAIVNARVFDGETTWPRASVEIRDGEIVAIGESLELQDGIETIDGTGKTLIPGLFDAHVHAWGAAREDSVRFGVTTLLDQFTAVSELTTARKDRDAGGATDKADLFSAGNLATVEGGHGSQFGVPIDTIESRDEVADWAKARKAEGSDWIKIVVEPGGGRLPTLDMETVGAVINAAHANGLQALVHVSYLDHALEVTRLGADGLVHIWRDRLPTDEEVEVFRQAEIFVIPTLVVMEGMVDPSPSRTLATAHFDGRLSEFQKSSLEQNFPPRNIDWSVPVESVRKLAEAGVPILAGSDAPNPATAMGLSIHREMELFTQAGLSATDVLASATSKPAEALDIPKRGRIAPGMLADLVLVEGDPTTDITATRRLVRVWKAGHSIDHRREVKPAETVEKAPTATLLADFEKGLEGTIGAGWSESTDLRMGGKSVAELAVQEGALHVFGEVKEGFMFPWAGAVFFTGSTPMAPVDYSTRTELRFQARGDGETYSVMILSGAAQRLPATLTFEADAEWQTIVLPLTEFTGAEFERLRGVVFAANALGEFKFEIDDVEIR